MLHESLIQLNEVPTLLPKRRGRRIHMATIYRWASQGCRGRRLQTWRAGNLLLTSHQALQEFLQAKDVPPPPPAATGTSKAIEQAERELREAGI